MASRCNMIWFSPRTAELIQQYLKEVGISVKVVGKEQATKP
jgi:ABC-type transport system substrate-binding protein